MSDLIDLSSPEEKKLRRELPSPLIPSPENASPDPPLNTSGSRKSMDNNPFDMVLRKTSEFISKSSDPFEIIYDQATNPENHHNLTDFTDDLLMSKTKKKRYSDILKINKTLDESLLKPVASPGSPKTPRTPKKDLKPKKDEEVPEILVLPPSPSDNLSILDQSAMNDSFRTCSDVLNMSNNPLNMSRELPGPPGDPEKSILNNSAMNDSLSTSESSDDCFIKSLIAQRVSMCIRKGTLDAELLEVVDDEKKHCKNHKLRRSFSQGDRMSPRKFRTKRAISNVNEKNFSGYEHSIPSILFEDPLNLGFINGGRGDFSVVSDYSELSNITRLNSVNSGSLCSWKSSFGSGNRGFLESGGSQGSFKDLLGRFNSLRMKSTGDEGVREELKEVEDDVFEEEGVKKSYISSQANILAKTFEELAEESAKGSNSSGENLLSIQLPTNFNLSPTPSPSKPSPSPSKPSPSLSTNQSPPPPPKSSETTKKEAAALLLRDLENVVKAENNPEIMKLLKNLEKALGVQCETNLQLLNSCRQSSNNDPNSPSKIPTKPKKSPKSKILKSPVKNPELDQKKLNKKSPGKILNSDNSKISPEDSKITPEIENLNKTYEETEKNPENSTEDNTDPSLSSSSTTKDSQDSFSTQKLILDIQLALGKLLEGCRDEPAQVLENLNKLLHPRTQKPSPSPRKSGLPYRSMKSLSHNLPELQKTPQKSPRPVLRRRSSVSQPKIESKETIQSSRRNSSDPGLDLLEKKSLNVNLRIKTSVPVVDKSKLKKKNSSLEVRKGPLKALVPFGSLQRPGTPKKKVPSPLKITTSTPDPSPIVLGKKAKAKPVASSTPDVPGKKSGVLKSPKGTMSWNISPVTPNAKGSATGMFGDAEGKGCQTPRKEGFKGSPVVGGLNRIKEKIIRGRRSEPLKGSPRGKSPLRENNAIVRKPLNLSAKFRRSGGSLGGFEKENKG